MSKSWESFVLMWLAAGCIGNSQAQTGTVAGTAAPAASGWKLSKVGNLSRLPGIGSAHKELLAKQGFFLVPQNPPPQGRPTRPKAEIVSAADPYPTPIANRDRTQATHLFHVYERNDYIRFPSFIAVDLAIDATHAYFDTVLRDLEQY